MVPDPISIGVIAPPGRLRDSLHVLLRMNEQVKLRGIADTGSAGLAMLEKLRPNLILIDASLPADEAWDVLVQVYQRWPRSICCIFVHSLAEEARARALNAEIVLQAGFSADAFWEALHLSTHIK